MLSDLFIVLLSAVVVIVTSNFALKSAVNLARHFKLSDVIIGMTILSIGTSLPEIVTHVVGSYRIVQDPTLMNKISGLVIGTNVGSDLFQQNFVLAAVGFFGIIAVNRKRIISDMGGLIGSAVLLLVFALNGFISQLEGVVLVLLYILYLVWLKKHGTIEEVEPDGKHNPWIQAIVVTVSFVVMAFAAELLVDHSIVLVDALPFSASFFGVVLIGVATAFPELTTSVLAALKSRSTISAGVLIGSNITNPMFALGLGAAISGYTVPNVVIYFDLPVKIATALLILYFLWDKKMKKWESLLLIVLYIAYVLLRLHWFPVD